MKDNWIKKLPTKPLISLLEKLMHADLLIESGMLSHEIDDVRVDYWKRSQELMKAIRETKHQILHAKTKNEAGIAEARLRLFEKEYQKIISLTRKVFVQFLLKGEYFAAGYLGGEMVIVPSRAWSGKINWDEEKIIFARKEYSHLLIIRHLELSADHQKLVEQYASEDIDAQLNEGKNPGRPSPGMHLVEQKLRQRAKAGELETSLNEESRVLAAWFKRNHPDKPSITAKTIANKQRSLYRELKGKSA
jgi:hypothetical protein